MADSSSSQAIALESAIDDMPATMRNSIASAYEFASTLEESVWRKAIVRLLSEVSKGSGYFDIENLADSLGLQVSDARKLVSGFSATIAFLTQNHATAEEFVSASEHKGILDQSSSFSALKAASLIVEARPELERSFSRRRLAASVLPYLETFEVTVDLRFQFSDKVIKESVSVAIVHLDTDGNGQEVWFQLAQDDIDDLIKKLTDARDQLQVVDSLSFSLGRG